MCDGILGDNAQTSAITRKLTGAKSLLPSGVAVSSIEIKVSFLSRLRSGSRELEVTGRALRVGRQIAFAEADARSGDSKLVGHATSSLSLLRP
jgi:acyl-coenzyme A thioesterase PaaI-like protein